ncbi:hypothetical protein K1719_005319 [Acacia pycnantha]|nr:hypothetical protein K1719_005319 [Acacia pycnantha]
MAAIETNTKSSMHIRSNSFPSAPHPILSQFEGHLNRLKSSEAASSSSSISHKLSGLQDLHDFTDKLLQLSTIQQSLARECDKKSVDQLLEGKRSRTPVSYKEERILKEARDVTVNSLESLLLFICDPKGQLKQSKWPRISKMMMMQAKRIACDSEESKANEFENVDAALESLIGRKHSSMEDFQNHLGNLEVCSQDLEIGVEGLSQQLIRTRVQLLNIFNH